MSLIKKVTKAFKKATKNPLNIVFPGLGGVNSIIGDTLNLDLTQMALFAGGAALMATGFGAPAGTAMLAAGLGAGVSAAQQGGLGRGAQDLATMGASAQARANQRLANIYNQAQEVQARAIQEQNQRNLLQQIRSSRIQRAQALTDYAGDTGVTSSSAIGNLSSIGSQQLSNTTYSVRQGRYQNQYQTIMNQYNAYQTQAQNNQIKWNNYRNMASLGIKAFGALYNPASGVAQPTTQPYQGINVSYGA